MSNVTPNYNPDVARKGSQLVKDSNRLKNYYNTTLVQDTSNFFTRPYTKPESFSKYLRRSSQVAKIENGQAQLNKFSDFTFEVPGKQKYDIRQKFVDESGQALYYGSEDKGKSLGLMLADPAYMEYAYNNFKKQELMQFKTFLMNQVDMNNPVQREYWKNRFPEFYDELIKGYKERLDLDYIKNCMLLVGPNTEEDFKYFYENFVKNDNSYLDSSGATNPTELPWPKDGKNEFKPSMMKKNLLSIDKII